MTAIVTPLQRVVGFHVSEQTYDLLDFTEQVVLDLMIEGWQNIDIAQLLGIRETKVKQIMIVIRAKLAGSMLYHHLEMKTYYKEQTRPQLDETKLKDTFTILEVFTEARNDKA